MLPWLLQSNGDDNNDDVQCNGLLHLSITLNSEVQNSTNSFVFSLLAIIMADVLGNIYALGQGVKRSRWLVATGGFRFLSFVSSLSSVFRGPMFVAIVMIANSRKRKLQLSLERQNSRIIERHSKAKNKIII